MYYFERPHHILDQAEFQPPHLVIYNKFLPQANLYGQRSRNYEKLIIAIL